ncbi:putative reverse transcriptase domain-containing protein [Tanacetum coccineum]
MTLQENVWMVEEVLCFHERLGCSDRIEPGALIMSFRTHRDYVYAHETYYRHTRKLTAAEYSHSDTDRDQMVGLSDHQRMRARDERTCSLSCWITARPQRRVDSRTRWLWIPDHLEASGDATSSFSVYVIVFARQIRQLQHEEDTNTHINDTPKQHDPESVQAMIDQALLRNSTNGDGSHSSNGVNRRNVQTARPCFYADFMKCQPLNFKGAEGVVGLTRWIEKMESVFNISGCAIENQGEIKKLEIELWNLKVKGNDVPAYSERFQELTLICTKFVANETEKVDKYLSGLPDNIYGNVKAAKPKTLDETIELANDLMDRKLLTYAERQSDNKRRADDSSRNNHGHQQQPFKRQNVAKVYNMGTGERKPYGGSLPKCNKCHLHHNGPCTQRCHKCNKIGHFARDCRNTGNTNVANTQKGNGATPNRNVGNAEKRGNAPGNPDANVVTGTFLLNNHYASILFDTGADRSFISTAFSSLISIAPTSLENCYDVELADGKLVKIDTIIRGCTLNFLDHPFNIDLMPVELGSFDVIIGMDWLRRCHAVIVCDEKLVQVPYGNETLTFCSNESSNGRESRLTVISCSKAQEYMAKGCQVFLAQISAKKEEDRSERKPIEDVPIVRDFPEVFPEDLPESVRLGEKERTDFPVDKAEAVQCPILALPVRERRTLWVKACIKGHQDCCTTPNYRVEVWQDMGYPASIICATVVEDYTSIFGASFLKAFGYGYLRGTAYHPETDGQSERPFKLSRTCYVLA